MGILDDAIRQHLELKRQHGAPEEELQRQEEEALGPARRDVAPAEPSDGDGEVELDTPDEAAETAASELETELFDSDAAPKQPEAELEELEEPAVGFDEPATGLDEPATGPDQPAADFDEPDRAPSAGPDTPFELDEEPGGEHEGVPEPDALPPSPAPFDADAAFEEFGERDEPDADDEEEPDGRREPERDDPDVLEDTPDFLQETPEHDRLWFEQKPPRDFDFD